MSQKKINSIQLLRTVAVSLVIFFHAATFGIPKFSNSNPVDSFYHLKNWGAIGVDLFFSISGFIMTIVVRNESKPGDWKTYFGKRLVRILPLYYLLSALVLAASTLTFLPKFVYLFAKHHEVNILVVIKSLIFFPIFDRETFTQPLLAVGWSLSYEMYFYAIIGILMVFRKDIYRRLLVVIAILSVVGVFTNFSNPLLKFLTSPILLEFGFGVICGLIYKKVDFSEKISQMKKAGPVIMMILGLGLMCVTIFQVPDFNFGSVNATVNSNIMAFYRALIWGLPSAIFMLGVILYEKCFRAKIITFFVLAGDASYSCYLIHTQVYSSLTHFFGHFKLHPWLYVITIIPICLVFSILFYKLIERNLVTSIDKLFHYKKPVIME